MLDLGKFSLFSLSVYSALQGVSLLKLTGKIFHVSGKKYSGTGKAELFCGESSGAETLPSGKAINQSPGEAYFGPLTGPAAYRGRLSRPRRPGFRSSEIRGVGVLDRALDRTGLRIELPRPDYRARQACGRLAFFNLLRGFGFCPLAGLGFGHGVGTFPGCWGNLSGILARCPNWRSFRSPRVEVK